MTVPDGPRHRPGSAGGEEQLEGSGAQDQHQQGHQGNGRGRSHLTSVADGSRGLHTEPAPTPDPPPADEHVDPTATIDAWLAGLERLDAIVLGVGDDDGRRFIRLQGDEKSVFTVWLRIGQRTLHHETFVMPAPIENQAEFYAHLLRRNHSLRGVAFTIGAEDAVFLEGRTPLAGLDGDVLDEVLGTHFEAVERCFRSAMRIGWRSLFRG